MPTDLRHDLDYLRQLLNQAIRLHRPSNVEEATMLADIRDYMYLTLDALGDRTLAERLVGCFTQLQTLLETMHKQTPVSWRSETIRWYIGWLFALEQLLSLKHEINVFQARPKLQIIGFYVSRCLSAHD